MRRRTPARDEARPLTFRSSRKDHALIDLDEAATPKPFQKITAIAGLFALAVVVPAVVGIFGAQALSWVLVLGGLLTLTLGIGLVVRGIIARRFPITSFDLGDVSEPAVQIEGAKARLADGDYAAFTINAVRNEDEPEASGQIWFYEAKTGGIEKTSIELSYEWPTESGESPALMGLVDAGWEITGQEPDHWVLLSRQGDVDASEAIRLVVGALQMLARLEASTKWTIRAFA